jgi:hypothetical protein
MRSRQWIHLPSLFGRLTMVAGYRRAFFSSRIFSHLSLIHLPLNLLRTAKALLPTPWVLHQFRDNLFQFPEYMAVAHIAEPTRRVRLVLLVTG